MTSLIQKVTPLTRGLIWSCPREINSQLSNYKEIDYLVNGLLTASLIQNSDHHSRVIVSENFGHTFYVLVGHEISDAEFSSYFNLIKNQLTGENHLLLVDENKLFNHIQKVAPSDLKSKIMVTGN